MTSIIYILFTLVVVFLICPSQMGASRVVTCAGMCGVARGLPCSCDAECVVYKNCCENMTTDCPDVMEEGRQRFGYLLHSEISCSEYYIFWVTSCPRPNSSTFQPQKGHDEDNKTEPEDFRYDSKTYPLIGEEISNEGEVENLTAEQFVIKVLENAPVVDTSTGIVYINADVFACHDRKKSSSAVWNNHITLFKVKAPSTLKDFKKDLESRFITYTPPVDLRQGLRGRQCIYNSLSTCNDDITAENPELATRCMSDISYVLDTYLVLFRNRFCLQCKRGMDTPFVPIYEYDFPSEGSLLSSVTVSRSETGSIDIVAGNQSVLRPGWAWKETTCSLLNESRSTLESEQTVEDDKFKCTVTSCQDGYAMRSDGQCLTEQVTTIAFADDGYPLSSIQIERLPQYTSCSLNKLMGIETIDDSLPTATTYDITLQTVIYQASISVWLPAESHLPLHMYGEERTQVIDSLLTMAKSFKEYRKRHLQSCEKPKPTRNDCPSAKDDKDDDKYFWIGTQSMLLYYSLEMKDIYSTPRGNVIDNTSTTVCLGSEWTRVCCINDLLFEADMYKVNGLLGSSCFDVFEAQRNQAVGMTRMPIKEQAFIAAVVLLMVKLMRDMA